MGISHLGIKSVTRGPVGGPRGEQGPPGPPGAASTVPGPKGDPGTGAIPGGVAGNLVVIDSGEQSADSGKAISDLAPALGADDNYVTDAEKTKLTNLSGINTGDQDLSGKVDKVAGKELSTNDLTNELKAIYDAAVALAGVVSPVALTGATLIDDTTHTDTYAGATDPAIATYEVGLIIYLKATNANTGASTLNVCSLGAKSIKKNVTEDLAAGEIKAGQILPLVYDGTNFQVVGGGGGGGGDILAVQVFS